MPLSLFAFGFAYYIVHARYIQHLTPSPLPPVFKA
jgi:hypothetical protein